MGIRSRLGRRWAADDIDRAIETAVRTTLREATTGAGVDPDEHLWRSLTGNAERDLPQVTHDRAQKIAFSLNQRNPLARRVLALNRDYVVGDGIPFPTIANPSLEDLIGEFWHDDDNAVEERFSDFVFEAGLYGEQFIEAHVGPISGVVKLGIIDPQQVVAVEHVPGNPLIFDAIRLRPKDSAVPTSESPPIPIIRRRSESTDGSDAKLDGAVWFWKLNSVQNATRGWPDLLHVADWLDGYDQLLWEMLERARLVRTFIWDVVLKNADQPKIRKWIKDNGTTPRSGSVRVHNEQETWQAVAPQLGSFETKAEAEVLLEHIAGGAGFPKTWLSSADDVNRAASIEMGTPTERQLGARQRYFVRRLQAMLAFVVEKGAAASRLPDLDGDGTLPVYVDGVAGSERAKPMDLIAISAPEISRRDISAGGTLLTQIASAMAVAESNGWFGGDSAPIRQAIASALSMIGVDWDPDSSPDDNVEPQPPGAPAVNQPPAPPQNGNQPTDQTQQDAAQMAEAVRRTLREVVRSNR